MDGSGSVLYPTTKEIVSEHAFKIILWVGVGICTAICILRLCIRFVCFRRLLSEDYLILAAWAILIAIATVLQIHLGDLYSMLHVQNRQKLPDINFFVNMRSGLRGELIAFILIVIGIWLIKLNFMLLFYRIGYQVRSYLILWWVALVLVVGFGAVNLALLPYDCQLGDIMHITMECAKQSRVKEIYLFLILTIVMDVLSDVIIICFPVLIVWNTALSGRQKMVLSSVFLLVSFTIGVTITRGSVFGGVFKAVSKTDRQVIDSVWMAFWWCIEYITSFVIACLVSFRSLWSSGDTARGRKNQAEKYRAQVLAQHIRTPSSLESQRNKRRRFYDSLLDTFSELEGSILDKKSSSQLHLESHLATIDVDFSTWESNHSTDGDDRK